MSGTKEIKDRIESVRDTQKITNAMYLIASTKLRKARAELDRTRPYFDALRSEIKRIFRTVEGVESRYFYPGDDHPLRGTYAYLVITADKGLAGMYNQNVLREAQRLLNGHADAKLLSSASTGGSILRTIRSRSSGASSTLRRTRPCSVPARSAVRFSISTTAGRCKKSSSFTPT